MKDAIKELLGLHLVTLYLKHFKKGSLDAAACSLLSQMTTLRYKDDKINC